MSRKGLVAVSRLRNHVAVYEYDPDEGVWLVHIAGIDGCQTYGRSLRQAEARITEALAAWLDRDPETLVITPQLPDEVASIAGRASRARYEAERAGTKAHEVTTAAVKQFTEMGLSR